MHPTTVADTFLQGLDAAEKKFGYNVSRENNEKITDAGRSKSLH